MEAFDPNSPETQLKILDPKGSSLLLKIEDSPERLLVRPAGLPMWLILLCLPAPVGVFVLVFTHKALHEGLEPMDIVGIVFVSCAAPGFVAFFWSFNRYMEGKGVFCVLDREDRTLSLPRVGLTLKHHEIVRFIEVHGWHIERGRWSWEGSWVLEVSVVWRGTNGELVRSSVVISDGSGHATRVGKMLAEFFGVEHRMLRSKRDEKVSGPFIPREASE